MHRYHVTPYDEEPPDLGGQKARIMVPFVQDMLCEGTVAAVRDTGLAIDYVLIDAEVTGGYAQALASRWNLGTDLVVVEQDIVPLAGMIDTLLGCEHPWCSHRYWCGVPQPAYGLGLCRFTADLQKARPSLGPQATSDHRGRRDRMHWIGLNERVISLMEHFGHYAHIHEPMARHLHEYQVEAADHG